MKRYLLILLALFFFAGNASFAANGRRSGRKILLIHSVSANYSRFLDYSDGFVRVMNDSTFNCDYEQLSLETDTGRAAREKLRPWEEKLRAGEYAAVVGFGDESYQLIRSVADLIPARTAIVFVALGTYENDFPDRRNVIGNIARNRPVETLKLARKLLPERRRIILVYDDSPRGIEIRREVARFASMEKMEFNCFNAGGELAENEMIERIRELRDEAVLLYHDWKAEGGSRRNYDPYNHARMVKELVITTGLPVFVMRDQTMQYGVVGGCLWRGMDCGEDAAKRLIAIFDGRNTALHPCITDIRAKSYMNWKALKFFNIPESRVPDDVIFTNRPDDFWINNRRLILWGGGGVVVLFGVLMLMAWSIARGARNELRNHAVFDKLPIRIFILDRELKVVSVLGCNDQRGRFLKRLKNISELPIDNYDQVVDVVESVFRTGEPKTFNFELDSGRRTAFCYKLPYNLYRKDTVIWVSQDTRELQNARDEARRQLELCRSTLNNMPDAVITLDGAGAVLNMNSVAEKLFGVSSGKAGGQPAERIFRLTDNAGNPFALPLAPSKTVSLQPCGFAGADGVRIPLSGYAAPVLDSSSHNISGTVLVLQLQR